MGADLLIPEGGILLHIGPFKTGSTALQQALAAKRDELVALGVRYPGSGNHRHARAGWGVLGRTPRGWRPATIRDWHRLVAALADLEGMRGCVSTEDFGTAGADQVARIVADLGPERLHVVAVARRLDRLLPSQWQQRVKSSHECESYDRWLEQVLGSRQASRAARSFWAAHDLGSMLGRWVPLLPPERMTVLVSDDSDRGLVPRAFEAMLGLPAGLLDVQADANSSMSLDSVELLRRVNRVFKGNDWPDQVHRDLIYRGARRQMPEVVRDSPGVRIPRLPDWAAERVAELSERRVRALREHGVRVVGDPEALPVPAKTTTAASPTPYAAPGSISMDAAVAALEGVVRGALVREARIARSVSRDLRLAGPPVAATSSRTLVHVLARRVLQRLRRRAARASWRLRGPQ